MQSSIIQSAAGQSHAEDHQHLQQVREFNRQNNGQQQRTVSPPNASMRPPPPPPPKHHHQHRVHVVQTSQMCNSELKQERSNGTIVIHNGGVKGMSSGTSNGHYQHQGGNGHEEPSSSIPDLGKSLDFIRT